MLALVGGAALLGFWLGARRVVHRCSECLYVVPPSAVGPDQHGHRLHAVAEDPVSDALAQVTPLPGARHNHLMQDLGGGEYLVAGGQVEMGGVQAPATFVFHYTGDAAGGYGTWREGPPLPSFSTPSGPSSFIRGQAELEYGRLAEGTLWIGNGFDATLPGTTKPNGRSYVLVPSSPLPLSF